MNFKNAISVVLILSQMSFASAAYADTRPPAVVAAQDTPEMSLLTSLIVLSGQNLPKSRMKQEMRQDLQQYTENAPISGRDARMEQALIHLGIFTPQQAQAFTVQVQSARTALSNAQFSSAEQAEAAIAQKLETLPQPMGAQYSDETCAEGLAIGALAAVAMVEGFDNASGSVGGALCILIGIGGLAVLALDALAGFGCVYWD